MNAVPPDVNVSIHIDAPSAQQAREAMRDLLGMDRETQEPAEEPAPKATRTRKAKADEGNAGTEPAASADTSTASDNSPASSTETESPSSAGDTKTADGGGNAITRATVEPKCLAYSQKGGSQALKELFIEMGSPAGKWSSVPEDKLPALDARLDELLAG